MHAMEPRPVSSSDWVMNDLRRQIADGSLPPGERLASVVDLATRYKVGRSTIREALSSLKAMGLLDIRHGSGTYVREAPPAADEPPHPARLHPDGWMDRARTLTHFLEIRLVLETGCARLAARNRDEADLAELAAILREMEASLGDETAGEQADVRFHERIAAATHNPALIGFLTSLSQQLHESMRDTRALWFYAERSTAERLLREHRELYEAIAAGDENLSASLMERHIHKVGEVLHERSE